MWIWPLIKYHACSVKDLQRVFLQMGSPLVYWRAMCYWPLHQWRRKWHFEQMFWALLMSCGLTMTFIFVRRQSFKCTAHLLALHDLCFCLFCVALFRMKCHFMSLKIYNFYFFCCYYFSFLRHFFFIRHKIH